jgi:hypothetical protein
MPPEGMTATESHRRVTTTERNAMTLTPRETAVLRYTVAAQFLEQHLDLLRAVYAELDALHPPHFSWATYRLAGSRDFIEVATGAPLPGPLPDLPSFRSYRADLDARCETRQFDEVDLVGSFTSA